MAAEESVTEESCISDPNFAIVCSFFENFSTLCGIKRHTISELQTMIDFTEEIPSELADLHIRMMRKAKKNVNPDRWQRTLAKFCYYSLPDDCWELEQKGYKYLHYSQRLRILLVLIGAQFDHNSKFKTEVNKLVVSDLRLSPFGTDKDGINYWLHTDEDLNLKVYKEDLEEEKWELIVSDRDGLEKLIKDLIKEKDPNRKLDEIEDDDADTDDTEDQEEDNDDDKIKQESKVDEQENENESSIKNKKLTEHVGTENEKEPDAKIELIKEFDPKAEDVKEPNSKLTVAKESDDKAENSKEIYTKIQISKEAGPKAKNVEESDPKLKSTEESKDKIENVKEPDPKSKDIKESDDKVEYSKEVDPKTEVIKESYRNNETDSKNPAENLCPNKTGEPPSESNISSSNIDIAVGTQNAPDSLKQDLKSKESIVISMKVDTSKPRDQTFTAKQPLEYIFKKRIAHIPTPVKPLDRESFTSHLKTLDSNNILRPLLNTEIVADPISTMSEALKYKLGVRSKPKLVDCIDVKKTTDMLLSQVKKMDSQPPVAKITKPGLKLEQILKSKLAQKLAANTPTTEVKSMESCESTEPSTPSCSTQDENAKEKTTCEPTKETTADQMVIGTPNTTEGQSKRKLSDCGENEGTKKARIESREEEEEIEEPMMLVTGVGSGRECDTGNNETESEKTEQNAATTTASTGSLTHKVDDILKNSECDQSVDATSVPANDVAHDFSTSCVTATTVPDVAEKKKPKLWTIDAICSSDSKPSDSSKNRYDDVSQFPNFNFNKEPKKSNENSSSSSGYQNAAESYSIFNLSSDSAKDDHTMPTIPTNFYFGCNNQNPCFLPAERNSNNYKPTTPNKSHNVKDIVENLDAEDTRVDVSKVSNFNVENLCAKERERPSKIMKEEAFNLCVRKVDASIEAEIPVENASNTVNVSEKVEHQQQALNLCSSDALQTMQQRPEIMTEVSDKEANETVNEERTNESGEAKIEPTADGAKISPEQTLSKSVVLDTSDNFVEENSAENVNETNTSSENENEKLSDTVNQSEDFIESTLDSKELQSQDSSSVESSFNVDALETDHHEAENENITDVELEMPSTNTHLHSEAASPSIPNAVTNVVALPSAPDPEKDTREPEINEKDTREPEVSEKDTREPEVSEKDTREPGISEDTREPGISEKDTRELEISEKDTREPEINDDLTNEPEQEVPEPTVIDVEEGNTSVNEKLESKEILDSETVESTQPFVSEMIKESEVNLDQNALMAESPKTKVKESTGEITVDEKSTEDTEDATVNDEQGIIKNKIESIDDVMHFEEENQTVEEKPETENPPEVPVMRASPRLSRAIRDKTAKSDEQLPSSSTATITKTESEKDTKTPKKGKLKNKTANEEEDTTAKEEESDDSKKGKGHTPNDESEQEETVEKKPLRKGRSATLKTAVSEPEETMEVKPSRKSRSQTQKNDVSQQMETSKKGKNQTSKTDENEHKEVVETKPVRKGRSQTQKNDSAQQEKPVETKSSKKSKSPAVTAGTKSSRTSRSRTQRKDANELEDKTETKSPKKGKNKASKNDENEFEESVKVKSTRSSRSKTAKTDEVEVDDATETKSMRKGKSRSKDESSENEEAVKIKFDNEKPEDCAESKTGVSANEGVTSAAGTSINENVSNETGAPVKEDAVSGNNDDVSLISKRPKSKKKAKKKRKSAKSKVGSGGSGAKKESTNVGNNLENDAKDEKGTTSKKPAKSQNDDVDKIFETLDKSETVEEDGSNKTQAGKKKRRGWLNEVDVNNIAHESAGIRQSRRIAQLKIKEQAEVKYVDPITTPKKATPQKTKPVSSTKKTGNKTPTKKSSKNKPSKEDSDEGSFYEKSVAASKKKKKKKDPKKNFDVRNAWKASSGTSSEEEEPEDEDHFEDDEELVINDRSDHEFSPESDIDDDDDYIPVKRARTAHSKPEAEDKPERDDLSCQSCGAADQPEWILLCDMCDEGWHAACLKPPVLSIPEGNWYCPPCQHNKLITNLQKVLKTYDKSLKKRANEELRKKRLEYVGISFSNIIIENDKKAETKVAKSAASDDYSEEEESEEEEPLYQLRVRKQANVSHRLSEYEELMNSAIQREIVDGDAMDVNSVSHSELQNGREISKEIADGNELPVDDEKTKNEDDSDKTDTEVTENQGKVSPVVLQLRGIRRKPPRLTNLDVSSEEDHFSDEDFKGSSGDQDDDEEYGKSETDSDEEVYRKGREPVRRSTRARVTRYDNEFINDESDDEEETARKKKKIRARYSDSDSEHEDSTWGKRKKSKTQGYRPSRKKRRRITFDGDSDEDRKKPARKSRVTYGLDESEEDYPQRRTRGKKISYLENLDSDSEEDTSSSRRKQKKIISDDEEYVDDDANEELDTSKESVIDENGKGVESGSDIDQNTVEAKRSETPNELPNSESKPDKSNSPVNSSPKKNQPFEDFPSTEMEKTAAPKSNENLPGTENVLDTIDQHPNEPGSTNDGNKKKRSGKSPKKDVQMYSGVVKGDNKLVLKKVDSNPSLEGLQSMAQSLSHSMNSSSPSAKYSMAAMHDSKYPGLIPTSLPGPTQANFADVGISYEDSDGIPMKDDKFAPPLRVVSPSKLYSMQESQQMNRPPPPFPIGQRMRPPHMLGAPVNQMMMPVRVPMPMQGPPLQRPQLQRPPLQGPPMQGPPMQGPPTQGPPMQGPPMQGPPMQGPPMQGPPMQGPPMQGPSMQGPPMQGLPMQRMNHPLRGPPPNANVPVSGSNAGVGSNPAEPVSRRGRRGRGKKQLEMERLEREREAMEAANRGDEMMPLHMLKMPTSEMNVIRPPGPYANPPGPSQFPGYPPNVQRMPFSQASSIPPHTSPTVTIGGSASKRVKITPTRMRMPGSQTSARFPRPPGTSVIYTSHPHDPSPSGGAAVIANDSKTSQLPSVPSSTMGAPTLPVKSEAEVSGTSVKREPPDQYYHTTSFAPSQIPRGYNQRPPEFSFVRNPLPPMYRQQIVSSPGAPTNTAFSRPPYANTSSVITGGPPSSLPASVNSSPSAKPEVTNAPSQVPPHAYPSPYSQASTPSSTSSPVSVKLNLTTASYTTPTHTTQSGPPTSSAPPTTAPYQMLHTKPLPIATQQSSTSAVPYAPPYYTSPMMPNSYPPQQPPSTQLPPVSSFGLNAPVNYANQPGIRVPPPPLPVSQQQQQPPPSLPPSSTASPVPYKPPPVSQVDTSSTNSTSADYLVPSSQSSGSEFQFTNAPQSVPTSEAECSRETEFENSYNQSTTTYEEEKHASEEPASGGEFGGLVSYFSSQHEDDLDS